MKERESSFSLFICWYFTVVVGMSLAITFSFHLIYGSDFNYLVAVSFILFLVALWTARYFYKKIDRL